MMDYLKLIFALLIPIVVGLLFVSLISPKKEQLSPLERLSLAFLIGTGIITLEMLVLGIFKIKFTVLNIMLASAIISSYPASVLIRNKNSLLDIHALFGIQKFKWHELAFLSIILLRIIFVFFESLIKPVIGVDAFANWSFRAKVFFIDGGLALYPGKSFFLGGGAAFYPLNIPLLETWLFTALGYWNDLLVKIIFPMFFACLLILLYCSIRRYYSRTAALLSTYLLSSLPLLIHHSTIEYADFPLCVYFTCSILFMLIYFESRDNNYLYISAILSGIGSWTKSEGMPLFFIILFIIFLYHLISKRDTRESARNLLAYFLLAMIFKAPWSIFNIMLNIPKNVYQNIEYYKVIDNLYRIPVIIEYFYNKFLFYGNWNISWFVFAVILILSLKYITRTRQLFSLLTIFLCIGAFAFMYYLTPNYAWLLDGTTLNRNTLIIMPIIIYFISINVGEILDLKEKRG